MHTSYDSVNQIIKAKGSRGMGMGFFNGPKTVAIEEKSQNIYITEGINRRITVFNPELQYLFHFPKYKYYLRGLSDFERAKRGPFSPWGIHLTDMLMFVTDKRRSGLYIFLHDGTLVTCYTDDSIMKKERKIYSNVTNVDYSYGIAVDSEMFAYICGAKNKLRIFQPIMPMVQEIENIPNPIDVKLKGDIIIMLVNTNDISIMIFSKADRTKITSINLDTKYTEFMHIDILGNILISDSGSNELKIYNSNYESIRILRGHFSNIKGLPVNKEGRIINVCEKDGSRLKIL